MLLKSNERPTDYAEGTETTKEYKVRTAQARYSALQQAGLLELHRPQRGDVISRGLDKSRLQRKYDPQRETGKRLLMGSYRVPLGVSSQQLHELDKKAVVKWIRAMETLGWDWVQGSNIETGNGVYPALDIDGKTPDLGSRERLLRTTFKKREIEIIRTELRPYVTKNLVLGDKVDVQEY